ncbi:uncharacterized protein BJ171DRAFT_529556 [Polychytrium aggregatum]|uniref:uncharacterized protein n=1 Tax=Polychytrium aggregatum TaxID=110093 RepID=UPI0022FE3C4F|nr:uncharacterized protein BJ171DRAFT_529556 [Polychytrium aggregatum]KAI9193292.1 hypothetical protein BJ171DRAFT_529556 [Polychytrium aggregatum]
MIRTTDGSGDEPPPLEDMSVFMAQHQRLWPASVLTPGTDRAPKAGLKAQEAAATKPTETAPDTPASTDFGGLKKGFFSRAAASVPKPFNQPKQPKQPNQPNESKQSDQTSAAEPMPFIRPKTTDESSLRFSEVQQAMGQALANKQEWITPDFIETIEAKPGLRRAMDDPLFAVVLEEMQRDPQTCIRKYASTRPDLLMAFREIAGQMGSHLEVVEPQSTRSRTTKPAVELQQQLPPHEQELVERVQRDPEAQAALRDPRIQRIIAAGRSNPLLLAEVTRSADSDLAAKLQKLMQLGMLQIQN